MINENAEIPAPTADVPVADVASLPVSSITLKLPPFWPNDPLVWLAQVEAQFHTRNITSQPTKFAYIVSSLQPEIAQEIRDILLHPPEQTISLDRLKVAYLDSDFLPSSCPLPLVTDTTTEQSSPSVPYTTRSGRHVRFTDRYGHH